MTHPGAGLGVFAMETSRDGKRTFIATSYGEFWRRYKQTTGAQKVYYEVIREGSPCHLYYDLEFPKALNPAADGPAMCATLEGITAAAPTKDMLIDIVHT